MMHVVERTGPRFEDLQTAPIGGLGISLVRKPADSASYRRLGRTNCVLIAFRRQQPDGPPEA